MHPTLLRLTPLALALACLTTPARADHDAPDGASPDTVFPIGRVEVRGSSARSVLTSVDVVGADTLADATAADTATLLRRVPGVQVTAFGQGNLSGKPSLRGFNGEGEVNAVKLLIDGVPSNSHDGNMPWLDSVWPLEIERLTTVRGTNDPRYGQHQIAGHLAIDTRRSGDYLDTRLAGDSVGWGDAQLALGRSLGDWQVNAFAGLRSGHGQRDHSDADRHVLSAQLAYAPEGRDLRLQLSARQSWASAQEPGYLSDEEVAADPTQSPAHVATDGGTRRLRQFSARLEGGLAPALEGSLLLWRNEFDDTRFVTFSAAVSQQERDTLETHHGLRAGLRWQPRVSALHRLVVEGGAELEWQDDQSLRYLSTARQRDSQTRDQAWTQDTRGLWAQVVIEPVSGWRLVPGVRLDRLGGSFHNRLAGSSAPINDYGDIVQPKLSAVWSPSAGQSVYANWGRSFQVGSGAALFKVTHSEDLAPSINDGWELGWKFSRGEDLGGRVALWEQRASNEVMRKLNDPNNDSENIGATRRRGIDLQWRGRLQPTVTAWLGVSRQQAIIRTPDSSSGAVAGNELDHVPRWLYSAGADWQAAPAWWLSASVQGQSDYELNRANSAGRYGDFTLLNLAARWQIDPRWSLGAELKNATAARNEYVWWDGSQRLHAPGPGRSLGLSLRASL